jgi:hypothetical protein
VLNIPAGDSVHGMFIFQTLTSFCETSQLVSKLNTFGFQYGSGVKES